MGPHLKTRSHESGMSLISVMISLGLAAMLLLVLVQTSSNIQNAASHTESNDEMSDVRDRIRRLTHCKSTLGTDFAAKCASTMDATSTLDGKIYLPLRDKNGKVIGRLNDDNSMRIGNWQVRASCIHGNSDKFLQIAVAKLTKNATRPTDFAKDPLTGKILSWGPLHGANSRTDRSFCAKEIQQPPPDAAAVADVVKGVKTYTENLQKGGLCGEGLSGIMKGGSGISTLYGKSVSCKGSREVAINGSLNCVVPVHATFVKIGKKSDISYDPEPNSSVGLWFNKLVKPALILIPSWLPIPVLYRLKTGEEYGSAITSRPANDGKGWHFQCCIRSPSLSPMPFTFNPLDWTNLLERGFDSGIGAHPTGSAICVNEGSL